MFTIDSTKRAKRVISFYVAIAIWCTFIAPTLAMISVGLMAVGCWWWIIGLVAGMMSHLIFIGIIKFEKE